MNILRRIPFAFYVLLLACIGIGVLYMYMHAEILRKNLEIGVGVRAQTGVGVTEGHLSVLKKTLGEHEVELKRISGHFVKNNDVVAFIQLIEKFGQSQKIELKISSLEEEESTAGTETVPESLELLRVQFVASGSWNDLVNLLVFVESMPYATRIEQVQFKKVGEGFTKTGKWSGFFALTAIKEK